MDYHKLQQKLFEIDPSDRAQDIERLRQSASGNGASERPVSAPVERETVTESAEPVQLSEAEQMAALAGVNTSGSRSKPLNDEAAQLAALAGIGLNEGQKKGKSGQLKGRDKVGSSKPSKSGEQKNVTRGKLVGSTERDEESIEEGPYKDEFKQGFKDYNKFSDRKKKGKDDKEDSKPVKPLPADMQKDLAKYATAFKNIEKNPKLLARWKKLMQDADSSLELESVTNEATEQRAANVSSIKEDLLRRLNSRK